MNDRQAIHIWINHRNPEGFEILFRRYRKEAFFHAFSLLGNREDALDVCQEAFAKASSEMSKTRTLDHFYPWFYTILRNRCLNVLKKRHPAIEATDRLPEQEWNNQEIATDNTIDSVRTALNRLPLECQRILMMKYFENMNYQQISERLQIPRGTVMSRLYHARKLFKKEYDHGSNS